MVEQVTMRFILHNLKNRVESVTTAAYSRFLKNQFLANPTNRAHCMVKINNKETELISGRNVIRVPSVLLAKAIDKHNEFINHKKKERRKKVRIL